MMITVNGQSETIQPCKLGAFIQARGLNTNALVVEYNQQIVQQARWDDIELRENDTLELLSFVGGG